MAGELVKHPTPIGKRPAVDHKAEALKALETARSLNTNDPLLLAEAETHSNLAIAEGQERVAEELEGIRLVLGTPVRERLERELPKESAK